MQSVDKVQEVLPLGLENQRLDDSMVHESTVELLREYTNSLLERINELDFIILEAEGPVVLEWDHIAHACDGWVVVRNNNAKFEAYCQKGVLTGSSQVSHILAWRPKLSAQVAEVMYDGIIRSNGTYKFWG